MTREAQNLAVNEWMGIGPLKQWDFASLDNMAIAEERLNAAQRLAYLRLLAKRGSPSPSGMLSLDEAWAMRHAKGEELRAAFVRAIGQWKESPKPEPVLA